MSEGKGGGLDSEPKLEDNERMTPGRANQITLARVNTPTRNILKKFDNNGDGRIDASEIQTIVTTLVAEKFKSKAFQIGLIILCVFTAILLGAMFGLTWAVVAALKDTQVRGGVLVTNDKSATEILVGNVDLTVSGGNLVSRDNSAVISTSRVQSPGTISGKTPFEKLLAMQSLVFKFDDKNSSYALAIQGVARVPSSTAREGYIVRFQTASGTLTLEDGTWTVTNAIGPLLEGVFGSAEGRRRRLMEDGTFYSYVICENGECGNAIPCGYDGWDPCPDEGVTGPTGESDDPTSTDGGTASLGGTSSCSNPTPLVSYCTEALTYCYRVPTATQEANYRKQTGCTSYCNRTYANWVYNSVYGECESKDGSYSGRFCCV